MPIIGIGVPRLENPEFATEIFKKNYENLLGMLINECVRKSEAASYKPCF